VLVPGWAVLPDGVRPSLAVRVEGERIAAIGPLDQVCGPADAVLRAPSATLIPGLIDIHIHGALGQRVETAGRAQLEALMLALPAWGVTGVLPTIASSRPARMRAAIARLTDLIENPPLGARALGIHLEGPYFNPRRRGAQDAAAIRPPSPREAAAMLDLARGHVRLMALAPELPQADAVLRLLEHRGVRAAAGHTEASLEEIERAVSLGLRQSTHTGNAMVGLHHRLPGTLGAVLSNDAITCELIGDGVHVHPAVMKLVWRAKGTDRVVLVSDATATAGLPDGTYGDGPRRVTVRDGRATIPDGTLAGSCMPLLTGLKNMVRLCGAPLGEAVRMTSLNPAGIAGCVDRTGSIAIGKAADLVLLDPDLEPQLTLVHGQIAYDRRLAPAPGRSLCGGRVGKSG
jgi:N-acetylglucosamine-6-phosphate deacetylase